VLSDAARNNYVFVEENGVAKRVEVNLGLQQDGKVQIRGGLAAGARLVVSGQQRLTAGAKVAAQE
jgi:membrane fusion protein (multidrug efflux system)